MKIKTILFSLLLVALVANTSFLIFKNKPKEVAVKPTIIPIKNSKILFYSVDLNKQNLNFYYKNKQHKNYKNFQNLKEELILENKKLIFAMNGGMYKKDFSPQGLYIENGKTLSKIDTIEKAFGNFYMQPNGIFYITNNQKAVVCKTSNYINDNIKFATQSGPLLIIDGQLHLRFNKGSKNKNIRNGVGILPNGNLLFAMSKEKINFYDFAIFFKEAGCQNALYLDGFVSKTYLPSKNWMDLDGTFGVIIAEVE